jgi:hypothetical protein
MIQLFAKHKSLSDDNILEVVDSNVRSEVSRNENKFFLVGYNEYIKHNLNIDSKKIDAIKILYDYLIDNRIKQLHSLGSGSGLIEYILASITEVEVFGYDYDRWQVEAANKYFGHRAKFLFANMKEPKQIIFDQKPDTLFVSFGALYALNNNEIKSLMAHLNEHNVTHFLDFHAGALSSFQYFKASIKRYLIKLGILNGFLCHGYGRKVTEIKKLFEDCDMELLGSGTCDQYQFWAIWRLRK